MKIIFLIQARPYQIYFVNKVNEKYKVSFVIVEMPSIKKKFVTKLKKEGLLKTMKLSRNFILRRIKQRLITKKYNKYFQDKWKKIDGKIPIFNINDINSEEVLSILEKEKPDLILDQGTTIVKDYILNTAPLSLNLHWGLSPYYRGSHCTQWAILNWDPYNIGVTIHKLTKKIDGGDILAQKRARISPDSTIDLINMDLTCLGVEVIIKAIDKLNSKEELRFFKQDYSLGFLSRIVQWNSILEKELKYIEKHNLIEVMLKKPSRREKLPIIEI